MKMKKSVLALALAFGVTSAFAQDLTSKKGEPILPEAGDWAIGIDASPFLNYAGNFFGKTATNKAPRFNFLNTDSSGASIMQIVGKYFVDESTAYRGGVRLGFGSTKTTTLVQQVGQSDPNVTVENTVKNSGNGIYLSAGLEKRKGKTRLQGYYGGELGIGLSGSKTTNTYGNALTSTNQNGGAPRTLSVKQGSTFMLGIRGFIGVEYFVLPKISLGGEFGWGLGLSSTGQGEKTTEQWDTGTNAVKPITSKTGKVSMFGIDTDNNNSVFGPAASLRMNFHF